MINDGMKAYRKYQDRPINTLYLKVTNTCEIEPMTYEARYLEKQLQSYCMRKWCDINMEFDAPISMTSIDSSGTIVILTIHTKETKSEIENRVKHIGFPVQVSNTFNSLR